MIRRIFLLLLLAVAGAATPLSAEAPYRLLGAVSIGAGGGGRRILADAESRRLYVTRGSGVAVVDLDTYGMIGEIADAPGARGFAIAPDLGLGFTSNARESRASIVDLSTLKTRSKVDVGDDPDAVLYVPGTREAYVFNRRGHSATVFEARGGRPVTTIPLAGEPASAVVDPDGGRVYVEIEDRDEIAAIDVSRRRVLTSWPTAPCESPTGMAADLEHHHFFLGCGNGLLALMDALSGKVLSTVAIGGSGADCAFDPVTGLAFASSAAGGVTLAREAARDVLEVVQNLRTGPVAGAMALDRGTHRIFLATPAPGPVGPVSTFRILVFGRDSPHAPTGPGDVDATRQLFLRLPRYATRASRSSPVIVFEKSGFLISGFISLGETTHFRSVAASNLLPTPSRGVFLLPSPAMEWHILHFRSS